MVRKKNTILDDFEKEAREQGLTYRQAQIQETIALVKEGKLTKKVGRKSDNRKKWVDKTS